MKEEEEEEEEGEGGGTRNTLRNKPAFTSTTRDIDPVSN